MANICTNMFFCSTENEKNLEKVSEFIKTNFYTYYEDDGGEDSFECEFESRWCCPEEELDKMVKSLEPDDSLYIRVLSYEFGCEYAQFLIYSDGCWTQKM